VTVRFHLHPEIKLFKDSDDRLVLTADNAESWAFTCADMTPEVEESIYFAGLGGPRISRQLVLTFKASEHPHVHWRLMRIRTGGHPNWN
jgi:uncharacterized heparinase superfamily protein